MQHKSSHSGRLLQKLWNQWVFMAIHITDTLLMEVVDDDKSLE